MNSEKEYLKIPVSTSDETEIIFQRVWLYHFIGDTVLPMRKRAAQLANIFCYECAAGNFY